uniref:Uncharacterized protein n=1 Tax=Parascaris equorum TaxID=6256 RepID=A0A914RYF1_PAREQ
MRKQANPQTSQLTQHSSKTSGSGNSAGRVPSERGRNEQSQNVGYVCKGRSHTAGVHPSATVRRVSVAEAAMSEPKTKANDALCNDRGGRNVLGVAKLLRASNYAHDVSLAMHENQRCFGTLRLVDLAKACGATYRAKACGVLKATYSTVSAGGAMWSYDKQQKQHPQLT